MQIIKFWNPSKSYGFLSNFYVSDPINKFNRQWKTSEHLYQAMKFLETDLIKINEQTENEMEISLWDWIALQPTAKLAAYHGRRKDLPIRKNWEEVKNDFMLNVLRCKFNQNDKLKQLLLDTKDATLIEDSPFDYYWGCGANNTGLNMLGHSLMLVRSEIKREMLTTF